MGDAFPSQFSYNYLCMYAGAVITLACHYSIFHLSRVGLPWYVYSCQDSKVVQFKNISVRYKIVR